MHIYMPEYGAIDWGNFDLKYLAFSQNLIEKYIIVSSMALNAIKEKTNAINFVAPCGMLRNDKGEIIGCTGFSL